MAGDVGYSISRVSVTVEGRTLSNLRGAAKPDTLDSTPSRIMAGGKKAIGFNEHPDANMVDYPFTIAAPSGDEQFLDAFVDGHRDVTIIVTYVDQVNWPDGAYTGITGRGKISRSARQDGDEIGENAYVVHINGFGRTYKNAPTITKT